MGARYRSLLALLTEAEGPDEIVGVALERVKKWLKASAYDLGRTAPKVKRSSPRDWKRMLKMKASLEGIVKQVDAMLDEF